MNFSINIRLTKEWLKENKIFFETIAAFLLSVMAILLSILQLVVTNKQTSLTQIQTNLAQAQTEVVNQELVQRHREKAIEKARAWTDLRKSLELIKGKFPRMVINEFPALKNYTYKKKLKWLTDVEFLIYPLGTNIVLIESSHNYKRYLSMLVDLEGEIRLVRDGDPFPDLFYKTARRIDLHVKSMWIDLGMFRNSYAPEDSIFSNPTPSESFFLKGFPWEIDIRSKIDTVISPKSK